MLQKLIKYKKSGHKESCPLVKQTLTVFKLKRHNLTISITFSSYPNSPPWTHHNAVKHALLVTLKATLGAQHPLSVQSPQTLTALVTPLQRGEVLFFKEMTTFCTYQR